MKTSIVTLTLLRSVEQKSVLLAERQRGTPYLTGYGGKIPPGRNSWRMISSEKTGEDTGMEERLRVRKEEYGGITVNEDQFVLRGVIYCYDDATGNLFRVIVVNTADTFKGEPIDTRKMQKHAWYPYTTELPESRMALDEALFIEYAAKGLFFIGIVHGSIIMENKIERFVHSEADVNFVETEKEIQAKLVELGVD